MRQRVEEKRREVAEAIDDAVAASDAGLLVLAGEVQARARVRRALHARTASVVVETDAGGRAAGSDEQALAEAVADRGACPWQPRADRGRGPL